MKKIALSIVITLMFTLVAYTMLNEPIPVIEFKDIKAQNGRFQIKGVPLKSEESNYIEEDYFIFTIQNELNETVKIRHKGIKPGNFDEANEVVVIGRINREGQVVSDRLLVKCPSKYEADGKEDYMMKEY